MKRINELNNQLESQAKSLEDKLTAQREEISSEMRENLTRAKGERDLMEQRYEAKKRQIKDLESEYTNRITDQDKTIAVLQEKLNNVENKKFDLERRLNSEGSLVQDQLKKAKENNALEKKALSAELETLRVKCYELELELVESQANYDKDLALWQGKNQFVENQRDQYKSELNELQKNFEVLVQKFNQSRLSEKEEAESSQSVMLAKLENRYQLQVQEMKEQLKLQTGEFEDKLRRLERENKKLTNQLLESEKVQDDQMERKLRESMNNERKLGEELLTMRREHDNRLVDLQQRFEEEKEKSRSKVQKLEQMYKESENKRNIISFDHEREKAKWSMENGQLMAQQIDYLEQIEIVTQRKEFLQRENEKLLGEIKQLKRLTGGTMTSSIGGYSSGLASKRDGFGFGMADRSYSRADEKRSSGIGLGNSNDMKLSSDQNFLERQFND